MGKKTTGRKRNKDDEPDDLEEAMQNNRADLNSQKDMRKGKVKVGVEDSGRAIWNDSCTETLLRVCLGEVEKGNRKGTCCTKKGWDNTVEDFNSRTARNYSKKQIKNHLDSLRGFWRDFQTLKKNETSLGWDVATGTITASETWWEEKLKVNPDLKKFKTKRLPHFKLMEVIFGDNVATGEHAWTPTSEVLPRHIQVHWDQVEEGGEGIGEDVEVETALGKGKRRKALAKCSKKKKKKLGAAALSQHIETLMETLGSSTSVGMEEQNEEVQFGIRTVLELLKDLPGLERGSPLHIFAIRMMKRRVNREVFVLLKDNDLRLKLLEDEFNDDKKIR